VFLNQGTYQTRAPLLIAADINLGAPILWGSPHAVLAAPYHRDAAGLRDNEAIFSGDEASAREAVRRRGVDFLLICPRESGAGEEGAGGEFADRLLTGEGPAWLEAVPVREGARLFQVLAYGGGDAPAP